MQLARELTPRQAARTLEQALRCGAAVTLEPRNVRQTHALTGVLSGLTRSTLDVQVGAVPPEVRSVLLPGVYCDAHIRTDGDLFLFTTWIQEIGEASDGLRITLVTPESVGMANRRRYERTNATIVSQVRIWAPHSQAPAVGLMCNVSPTGLAALFPGTELSDQVLIGDSLRVQFELPGVDGCFELSATACNKSISRDVKQLTLGVEFAVGPDDRAGQAALSRLWTVLGEMMLDMDNLEGDA